MMKKIGFIGTGNMATAIVSGLLRQPSLCGGGLFLYDVDRARLDALAQKGGAPCACACDLVKQCDIIFLSVKPQTYAQVLEEIAPQLTEKHVLVSIAAGISSSYIQTQVGFPVKVVRAMPNTPLLLGLGATALTCCEPAAREDYEDVCAVFEACGIVEELPEEQMNEVIAVNGSSPAFVYLFAKLMAGHAQKAGIAYDKAIRLIAQTFVGSGAMLLKGDDSVDGLIQKVSSPGGTTLKALESFYQSDLEQVLDDAMEACTKRANELGK